MYVASVLKDVNNILGPGNRIVIYLAGCPHHCFHCESEHYKIQHPEQKISVRDFIDYLYQFDFSKYDGITISGGDPFYQKEDLLELVKYLSIYFDDILVYTGYKYEELNDPVSQKIFKYISVLIDGEYIEKLDIGEKLKGSSNQKFYFFKECYKSKYLELNKRERELDFHFETMSAAGLLKKEK